MSNIDEYPERENVPEPKPETGRRESPNSSVRGKLTNVARQVPHRTEEAIAWSRNSRLAAEAKNEDRNAIQRFFSNGVVGWIAKTAVQAIPLPVTIYGPGDVITGISAGVGRDILSGEHLDVVDRWLYLGATLIPGIPATILVTPARFLRRNVEDALHAKKSHQSGKAVLHTKDVIIATRDIIKAARKR